MSGHSKWSKVKHQKAVEDVKRSQIFSKLAAEISSAAKGNPDVIANIALKTAIEKARHLNMPKENIERAINRATGNAQGEEFVLEAYAAQGEGIIIKGFTDNKNRTFSEIRQLLSGHGAKAATPGAVSWNFVGDVAQITKPASNALYKLLDDLRARSDIIAVLTDGVSSDENAPRV